MDPLGQSSDELPGDAEPEVQPAPVKPGWQTSECWVTALTQLIGALGVLGVLNTSEVTQLTGWVGKFTAAAIMLVALVYQATHYTAQRTRLKKQASDGSGSSLPLGLLLVLGCLFLAAPAASAQPPGRPAVHPTGLQVGFVNLGCLRGGQRQAPAPAAPQTDPATLAALNRLADQNSQLIAQNAQMLAMLQARQQQAPAQPLTAPAPVLPNQQLMAPAPLVFLLAPSPGVAGQPQQVIPIAGAPQQIIPIAGAPQQVLPIVGQPQQQIPLQGQPQQIINIQGPPQQRLPVLPQQPQQQLLTPAPSAPQQQLTPAPPQQQLLPMPPATPVTGPAVGMIRYSTWPVPAR